MFLITLRVYATGGMLRTIGDVYGVSTSTVSKVVAVVTYNLARLGKKIHNISKHTWGTVKM